MDMTRPNTGNFFIRQATTIAIGAVSLLTLLAALSFWQQERASAEAEGWLVHTYEVVAHIESLVLKLEDAETSQRAYLLTGKEEYLEPYLDALRKYSWFEYSDIIAAAARIGTWQGCAEARDRIGSGGRRQRVAAAPLHRPGVGVHPPSDGR